MLTVTIALTKTTNCAFRAKNYRGTTNFFQALCAWSVPPILLWTGAPNFQIRFGATGNAMYVMLTNDQQRQIFIIAKLACYFTSDFHIAVRVSRRSCTMICARMLLCLPLWPLLQTASIRRGKATPCRFSYFFLQATGCFNLTYLSGNVASCCLCKLKCMWRVGQKHYLNGQTQGLSKCVDFCT